MLQKRFKFCVALVLVMLCLCVFNVGTASAKWRNFSFVNYSGKIISYLYISRVGYNKWGDDILGSSVLGQGDSHPCRYNDSYRYFDVKVVFSDGRDAVFSGHDFRSLWRLTIFQRNSGGYTIRSN